jgi:phosphoribosylformylglycinamidine (FGAM) synthase-like enzyme
MPESATLPTVEDALALGLTRAEYELVCGLQGEPPNQVELAMYSLLWSEHCAYKHSRRLLRTLPTEGPYVVMGPGENAGAVDVGGGLVCAFKVESHNHPSAVEPFQGAATGVGGILRDVFAVGARPVAVLDSLRFGEVGSGPGAAAGTPAPPLAPPLAGDLESGPGAAARTPTPPPPPEPRTDGGPPAVPAGGRARYLLDGAVRGIGHYGNSVGVPTIGGEVYFEGPYEHNCLVNAMALGLCAREQLVRAAAAGPGNTVVLFGATTGRDGIGGASVLASAELGEADDALRPTVQVGDPFEEKKLLECSLELLDRGLLVALQDLGAAGLTSAAAEMAAKGGVGLDLDVARVPLREPDLEPFEVMVSESQERMLCVVAPADVPAVLATCERWEVGGAAIGTVTATGRMRVLAGERVLGDMPVHALVDACPVYELQPARPTAPLYPAPPAVLAHDADPRGTLLALLASPNLASRRPLYEQYDALVQSRTVRRPGEADAAVLVLPAESGAAAAQGGEGGGGGAGVLAAAPGPSSRSPGGGEPQGGEGVPAAAPGLAVSIDGSGRRVAADPYRGTVAVVLECAANLACVGAEPRGLTNNLNFGNPERPHVAWQLTEAVRGLGDACRALGVPVVGGNVSLYNEGPAGPIYPTPVVGMVGHLPDAARAGQLGFARAGDVVALVGPFAPALAASELAKLWGEPLPDGLPECDVAAVLAAHAAVREAVRAGAVRSAHDVAEGGLAVALAECCLAGGVGAEVALGAVPDVTAALFGEGPGGFVVSGPAAALAELAAGAPVRMLGTVGGGALTVAAGAVTVRATLAELAAAHGALAALFP